MPSSRPTILALSSGQPPAAIAVVRISGGPQAGAALKALIGRVPQPGEAAQQGSGARDLGARQRGIMHGTIRRLCRR